MKSLTRVRRKPGCTHMRARMQRGNMLVFITASTVGLLAILGFFGLGFVRLLGSNTEQRTAIEAAALAAARDLSQIAVETPDYGLVSLSDAAPVGSATAAGDNFYTPVRSVNGIMGTLRLDLIIADRLGDNNLKAIIKKDLSKALNAQTLLGAELQKAIQPGYVSKDKDGNVIEVYKSAEAAYKQNGIRMTHSSVYSDGNLKLALGAINGGSVTNIGLPTPINWASVPAGASQNDKYMSYINIPYDNTDFVFAGVGDAIKLVNHQNWVPTVAGLPYQLATVVRAEADQSMKDSFNANGYTVKAAACAQPANVVDPKPAPGALTFSFPDGLCPEITKPGDMLTNPDLNKPGTGCSYQYSDRGDFPFPMGVALLVDRTWEFDPLDQNMGNVFRKALFDWWRRAGTKLDMASAVAMLNDNAFKFQQPSPLMIDWKTHAKLGSSQLYVLGQIPNGNIHIYRVRPQDGVISYQVKALEPVEYLVAGQNQMYSESVDAIKKSAVGEMKLGPFNFVPDLKELNRMTLEDTWDIYLRDQVYQPGKTGGSHSGEPLDNDDTAWSPLPGDIGSYSFGAKSYVAGPKGSGKTPILSNQSDFAETSGFPASYYKQYAVGSGQRPTYLTNGTAVDIRFRRQVEAGNLHKIIGDKTGYVGEKFTNPALPAIPPAGGTDSDGDGDIDGGDDD